MNQLQRPGYPSIEQMTNALGGNRIGKANRNPDNTANSFRDIFEEKQQELSEVKFSKHANERLLSRNIQLSEIQKERLNSGVSKASQKGIRDSLVMLDNLAFIVNVNSRTVITAVGEGDDKIFTNIDGAIIV